MTMLRSLRSTPRALLALAAAPALLAACASTPMMADPRVDNAALPEAVRVPAGEMQKLWTRGAGEITYECREVVQNGAPMPGQFAWAFVVPKADLTDANGKVVGKYYGGPTWEHMDGSKLTGKQVAVAPAQPGNIPLQLVRAEPAMGTGVLQGVSFIQRLNTSGGVAPAAPCAATNRGEKRQVVYAADYVMYGR